MENLDLKKTYQKDFDSWIKIKKDIEDRQRVEAYKYSIFWSSFGENIGSEVCGKGTSFLRPVVILKKFGERCVLVAPLSSKIDTDKNNINIKLDFEEGERCVLISQIRVLDTKRLFDYMGKVKKDSREDLKNSFNKIVKM